MVLVPGKLAPTSSSTLLSFLSLWAGEAVGKGLHPYPYQPLLSN